MAMDYSRTITIFGNKGGVGKTFVATNLGAALALSGRKVLLVDLDFQAGQDMARMLNLSPRYSIVDLLSTLETQEDPSFIRESATKHACGLDFLPRIWN